MLLAFSYWLLKYGEILEFHNWWPLSLTQKVKTSELEVSSSYQKKAVLKSLLRGGSLVVIDFGKIMRSFREVPGHPVFW